MFNRFVSNKKFWGWNGKKCDLCQPAGDYIYNAKFVCGLDGWQGTWDSVISLNPDGSVHLDANGNQWGALSPMILHYPSRNYRFVARVKNIVGSCKMSIQRANNIWETIPFNNGDGEYELVVNAEIQNIVVSADDDPNASCDVTLFSLKDA